MAVQYTKSGHFYSYEIDLFHIKQIIHRQPAGVYFTLYC